MTAPDAELVAVAKIVRTRGIKGEVVADLLTDFPERFDTADTFTAIKPGGERLTLTAERHWFQSGRIVFKFAGYDSIEDGERLRDVELCVPESEAVELEDGEFFEWELTGCSVQTIDGTDLGRVRELMRTGGTEVLVVEGEAKEYLIPFAQSICLSVDIKGQKIIVDPPEGLLEF